MLLFFESCPSDSEEVLYERVGLIDQVIFGSSIRSNDWVFLFNNAPMKTITIV